MTEDSPLVVEKLFNSTLLSAFLASIGDPSIDFSVAPELHSGLSDLNKAQRTQKSGADRFLLENFVDSWELVAEIVYSSDRYHY